MFRISSLSKALSSAAFSTLRIFPLSGRMAWMRLSRPCFAVPPAESPSTRKSSHFSGSLSEQSASLPGMPAPDITVLRWTISRAFLAAVLAVAARITFSMMIFANLGFSSRYWSMAAEVACDTTEVTSLLPSLVLVWPSNCGSATFTDTTAVRPSRKSSCESSTFTFSRSLFLSA